MSSASKKQPYFFSFFLPTTHALLNFSQIDSASEFISVFVFLSVLSLFMSESPKTYPLPHPRQDEVSARTKVSLLLAQGPFVLSLPLCFLFPETCSPGLSSPPPGGASNTGHTACTQVFLMESVAASLGTLDQCRKVSSS